MRSFLGSVNSCSCLWRRSMHGYQHPLDTNGKWKSNTFGWNLQSVLPALPLFNLRFEKYPTKLCLESTRWVQRNKSEETHRNCTISAVPRSGRCSDMIEFEDSRHIAMRNEIQNTWCNALISIRTCRSHRRRLKKEQQLKQDSCSTSSGRTWRLKSLQLRTLCTRTVAAWLRGTSPSVDHKLRHLHTLSSGYFLLSPSRLSPAHYKIRRPPRGVSKQFPSATSNCCSGSF